MMKPTAVDHDLGHFSQYNINTNAYGEYVSDGIYNFIKH